MSHPSAAPERIRLKVNGDSRDVPAGTRVAELLEEIGLAGRRVAVAVNREVVARSGYGAHTLDDGDRVEILEAVGGG